MNKKADPKLNCPHCNKFIETVHENTGFSNEYLIEKPEYAGHGLLVKINCPHCNKVFYHKVIAKEGGG